MRFSDEHKMMVETLERFLAKHYPPEVIRKQDEEDKFPRQILKEMADLGLTGLTVPEEYGGTGRDITGACLVTEELARVSLTLSWAYVGNAFFGSENINILGNEEQKQRFLPRLAKGELLFAYGLTEPNVGSDTAAVQTTAVRTDGGFLVNGSKIFISGASESDYILTLVRTDKDAEKRKGLSFLIIDSKSQGITFNTLKKLGVHGSDTCEVVFDNVFVPAENLLGGEECLNKGWNQLLATLDVEHTHLCAESVGLARGALDLTLDYIKQRHQFGQPISKFQAIRHKVAELATLVETARVFTYHLTDMVQRNETCWKESSMGKLFTSEIAKKVSLECLQLFGGYGYMMEYDIQRYVRDSLVLTIGGGTSEIQKNNIAGAMKL